LRVRRYDLPQKQRQTKYITSGADLSFKSEHEVSDGCYQKKRRHADDTDNG